jgi:anti-sigma-K factor RskA
MSPLDHDDRIDAAEYVLGLLEGEAKAQADRRLASDPAFAREVEAWRLRFADFDRSALPQTAGDGLWHRIEAAVSAPIAQPASSRASFLARWWDSVPALRAATLGASAAALLLAIALGLAVREASLQPKLVAVLLDGNRPGAVVHAFADGRVVLLPLTAISVPEGRALEVWTLPSRERGPVSVGLMQQPHTLRLELKDLPAPALDQLFEITLEPASGSPTGRPTGPVLFKGNTAQAL